MKYLTIHLDDHGEQYQKYDVPARYRIVMSGDTGIHWTNDRRYVRRELTRFLNNQLGEHDDNDLA